MFRSILFNNNVMKNASSFIVKSSLFQYKTFTAVAGVTTKGSTTLMNDMANMMNNNNIIVRYASGPKTNKSVKKRFRVRGNGSLVRYVYYTNRILERKTL